jgi:hypothetical protein
MIRLCFSFMLVAAIGCSKAPEPPKKDEPKGKTESGSGPAPAPKPEPGHGPTSPSAPPPKILEPSDPIQQIAERFITDLRAAAEKPEPIPADVLGRLSPNFLKIIGRPMLSAEDKKLGYSPGAASAWLKNMGVKLVGIGLPTGYGSPTVAVLTGSFGNGSGRFLMRLTFHEGWKVDWLCLGVHPATMPKPTSPEGPYQDFAVVAFLDAITSTSTGKDERIRLLGGLLTTKMKNALAEPFDGDKARGEDYNPSKLGLWMDDRAKGVTGISWSSAGPDAFKVELPLSGERPAYTLKLVKGAAPGEWLVDEFTKQ